MLYLGLEGIDESLAHHTIYLSADYRRNIAEIEAGRAPPTEPSFYVQNACVTDPELAPPGHSTMYVLLPVGNRTGAGIDWATEAPRLRATAIDRLQAHRRARRGEAHTLREDDDAAGLGGRPLDPSRRHLQPGALAGPDAVLPSAQPVRGSGRRLSGRRRHASRQRPAGDLRIARITARLMADDLGLNGHWCAGSEMARLITRLCWRKLCEKREGFQEQRFSCFGRS